MNVVRYNLWKSLAAALVLIVVIGGVYIAYLWATYLDEVTDAGEAYGLVIGESQRQTFDKLQVAFDKIGFDDGDVFIEVQADAAVAQKLDITQGRRVMVQPDLSVDGFSAISTDDRWTFYNEKNYQDFLRLSFCDDALCRIYRHRKHFELP
jgi:hypothetical protein